MLWKYLLVAFSSSSSESEEDLEYVPLDTDEFNPYQFIALLPSVKPSYPGKTPILPQKTKLGTVEEALL